MLDLSKRVASKRASWGLLKVIGAVWRVSGFGVGIPRARVREVRRLVRRWSRILACGCGGYMKLTSSMWCILYRTDMR